MAIGNDKKKLREKINLVNNLSNIQLTPSQLKVLNKGLNFCPSQKNINLTRISADVYHLERNMAWKYAYHDKDSNYEHFKTPFDDKVRKTNMPKYFPEGITTFADSVRSEFIGAQHRKVK